MSAFLQNVPHPNLLLLPPDKNPRLVVFHEFPWKAIVFFLVNSFIFTINGYAVLKFFLLRKSFIHLIAARKPFKLSPITKLKSFGVFSFFGQAAQLVAS